MKLFYTRESNIEVQLTEQPITGQPPVFDHEVEQRTAPVLPRVQLQRNERLIRFDQLMLDGRDRFRPIRLRRLDLARAPATDPVERRQRELVPGPALQSFQKIRVRLPVDHHFLPLGELATIRQQESLDGGAPVVPLFPLQLDRVGRGAGGEQSRRSWRHCAKFTHARLTRRSRERGDFERREEEGEETSKFDRMRIRMRSTIESRDVSRNEESEQWRSNFQPAEELCGIIVCDHRNEKTIWFLQLLTNPVGDKLFHPSCDPFPFITAIISMRCARKRSENFPGRGDTVPRVLSSRFRRERDPLTRFAIPPWLFVSRES